MKPAFMSFNRTSERKNVMHRKPLVSKHAFAPIASARVATGLTWRSLITLWLATFDCSLRFDTSAESSIREAGWV
jgi:hypothetical protein